MKRLICITLGSLLIQATVSADPPHGKGKNRGREQAARSEPAAGTRAEVHIGFGQSEVTIIREHYATRYRNLPPGLRKKVARGGQLPPGWQKKFEVFPVAVERRLPALPAEYRRGVIDGHAVIYNARTNVVIDVTVLF